MTEEADVREPGGAPLPTFEPGERVCGNCKLWRAHSIDAVKGWVGECRRQTRTGLFPPSAPLCDGFVARGETVTVKVEPVSTLPRAIKNIAPVVRSPVMRSAGGAVVSQAVGPTLIPAVDPGSQVELIGGASMTRKELMDLFLEASGLADVPLAPKWEGGTVRLIPGDAKLQAKDLPIDALFHKVVMVRDRLRVLEQKVNGHPKLSDAEKVEMQAYVTRCYGSLTTFNVLFKEKADQFIGQKDE